MNLGARRGVQCDEHDVALVHCSSSRHSASLPMGPTLSQATRSCGIGALKSHMAFNSLAVYFFGVDLTRSIKAPSSVCLSDMTWPTASPKSCNNTEGNVRPVEFPILRITSSIVISF